MATSADKDDREKDERDEAEDDEHEAEKDADETSPDDPEHSDAGKKVASASKEQSKTAKAPADEEEDEEEDDEDDQGDEEDADDEEDKEEPARKPARSGAKARGPGAVRVAKAVQAQPGSLGKSILLFFVIVIGLGAGFAILGREQPPEAARPKWKVGEVADVEVTLVRSDRQDLACASADEVAGMHCAFEAASKAWSKGGDPNDDKKLLKPYTTTDRVQFTAAGLWSEPSMMPDKLPATRFSVKCKFKVEGTLKNVGVRWEQTGQWYPQEGWYAGTLSGCTLN
jgi:hypothetical protein